MGVASRVGHLRRRLPALSGEVLVTLLIIALVGDLLRRLLVGIIGGPYLASVLIEGVTIGLAYGLAGIGLSMTYSILSFANFAHGDTMTIGAMSGWSVAYLIGGIGTATVGELVLLDANPGLSITASFGVIIVGVVAAGVLTAGLTVLVDRLVYRPMRRADGIPLLIASIGVALAFRYLAAFFYGTDVMGITQPSGKLALLRVDGTTGIGVLTATQGGSELVSAGEVAGFIALGGTTAPTGTILSVTLHSVVLIVVASVLMLGVHLLLQRTKMGTAMRAMADNKPLAQVTGIPTERVIRLTWIIGGALAGIAGFLIVLKSGTVSFNFGWRILLFIFAAVILGGIGSVYGAIAGGLVIGIVDSVTIVWLPSGLTKVAAFAVLILVLIVRPEGIFRGVTTA